MSANILLVVLISIAGVMIRTLYIRDPQIAYILGMFVMLIVNLIGSR